MKSGFYFNQETCQALFINVLDDVLANVTILKDRTSFRSTIQDIELTYTSLSVIAKNDRYKETKFEVEGNTQELLKTFQKLREKGLVRNIIIKEGKYFKVSLEGVFSWITIIKNTREKSTVKIVGLPNMIAINMVKTLGLKTVKEVALTVV